MWCATSGMPNTGVFTFKGLMLKIQNAKIQIFLVTVGDRVGDSDSNFLWLGTYIDACLTNRYFDAVMSEN